MGMVLKIKTATFRPARFAAIGLAVAMALSSFEAGAAGAHVSNATDAQKDAAKEKYQQAMQAFDTQKYEPALALFRESYAIVASPNSHLMIARSLVRLERFTEAYNEYEATRIEAERIPNRKYQPTARTARNERAEIESRLAFITPRVSASVSVGGVDVPSDQLGKPMPVKPGPVEIVLRTPSGGETRQQVTAEAGKRTEVALEPGATPTASTADEPYCAPCAPPTPAAAEPSGINQTTLGLVFGGIGLAGAATFVVFGLMNNSKYDDLQSQCANNVCSEDLVDEGETGRQYQAIANVGLGVGAVGLATGLILILTAPSSSPATKEMSKTKRWPNVAVSHRSVSISGQF